MSSLFNDGFDYVARDHHFPYELSLKKDPLIKTYHIIMCCQVSEIDLSGGKCKNQFVNNKTYLLFKLI